ncbi:hypothetical protein [Lapidilactobacillus gannanensis]|uniref:Uncharacterized protein n=1 Tax=Lapidilactobacillus gannanensis TaxID=2486002 RepID=A0ABW4BKT7_9LACO|nr:hypothetical protein [Lapidilactobacillus gannanensis]
MHKKGKIMMTCLIGVILIFGIFFYFNNRQLTFNDQERAAGTQVKTVLNKNISAINAGDLSAYLATITPDKRRQTKKELGQDLQRQKTQVTLKSFKLQKVKNEHALAKVSQLQVNQRTQKKQIIETNVEFTKDGQSWFINKSILYNIMDIK